jgi:hypothetical protein
MGARANPLETLALADELDVLNPSPRPRPIMHYAAFGLSILSELALPELQPADPPEAGADVEVRLGALDGEGWDRIVGIATDSFRLRVAGTGRFEVTGGHAVTIDEEAGASPAEVRAFLLGTVFGALFQQRGLLALHASAIAVDDDTAIAFLGESGAGKSTLAMTMNARGHRLLCDDVCVVLEGADGSAITWPGVRRLKLWSRSIEAGGGSTEGLEPVLQREDKFHVPTQLIAPYRPHRLRRIYLLASGEVEAPRITRLRGAEAAQALVSHTFRGRMVPFMEAAEQHFRACLTLLGRCAVYRLERPWDLARVEMSCDAIEQHLSEE